ncbi:MAG: DUF2281 domain-containing protein [Oscillospiraceae bacterium]|nr:DUF2281 domain-containing protein [Oscillospiraceae bacterium]
MQKYTIAIKENVDNNMISGFLSMLRNTPFIDFIDENEPKQPLAKEVRFGGLEGKVWMSDDFNAPMEEFEEYDNNNKR